MKTEIVSTIVGVLVIVVTVVAALLFNKWEAKHATSYQDKKLKREKNKKFNKKLI